jgi:hypothetical protein
MSAIRMVFIIGLSLMLGSCIFYNKNRNNCYALKDSDVGRKPINDQIYWANMKYCKFCSNEDSRYVENCKNYNTFWTIL